ncbi:NAD(P)/FAD-dependent oxidoreductase [Patescibacteria group bacterium]|nr:NAD(P)/FAD-dependent oxidoreductase [Patescibacteria group bacterium]
MLEKVILLKEPKELIIDGLFVEIGFDPDTTFAKQLGLELDEKNFIRVDNMMKTNVSGIFAAGDTTRHFGDFKQDITASAMGAVAATAAYEYFGAVDPVVNS